MFASLKEKLNELSRELKEKATAEFKGATTGQDPVDRQINELVDKATSDELIAPDWGMNMTLVDLVNSDPTHGDKCLKAIRKSVLKSSSKVQLLSLTLLETCVKNCSHEFHTQLAASEVWADIVKLAGDSSVTRVDAEVKDKMLAMVEDYARALKPTQFQASFESLLDQGVDFPVRGADDAVPILTPPSHAPTHPADTATADADADAGADAAAAAAVDGAPAPAAAGNGGDASGAAAADPLAGVDEQDRAAIAAALAELEAEERAAQEAERVVIEAEREARRQQQAEEQQRQQAAEAQAAEALVAADAAADAALRAGAGAHPPGQPAAQQQQQHGDEAHLPVQPDQPQQPEQTVEERMAAMLETASNSCLLLSETLAAVPEEAPLEVREPYVAELADACVRLRGRLERRLADLADEALLASALSQHEELSRVLARYEELLAAAESIAPTQPLNAAAVAAAHAAQQGAQQGQGERQAAGAGAGEPKLAQQAVAVAAALKEKMSGAFDKLMAAARSGTAGTAAGAAPAGAPAGAAPASLAAPLLAPAPGSGNFTLLDEGDEEADEGTSLITRRVQQQQQQQQQPAQPAWQEGAWRAQQEPAASAAPPAQPEPAAAAGPDLINFDEEEPAAVRQEAPEAAAAVPDAAAVWQPGSAAVADELLTGSGLTIQTPAASAAAPAATAAAAAGLTAASRGVSATNDSLVAALDALVSQDSLGAGAPGSATAAAAEAAGAQPLPQRD